MHNCAITFSQRIGGIHDGSPFPKKIHFPVLSVTFKALPDLAPPYLLSFISYNSFFYFSILPPPPEPEHQS